MTQKFNNIKDYQKAIKKDIKAFARRMKKAVKKTVKDSKKIIIKNAPAGVTKAGGGRIKSNIKADIKAMKVVCERPYSAEVEMGSPPKKVDVGPLLEWCKKKKLKDEVAYRIANRMKKHGVKPTFFMYRSLPEIKNILASNIKSGMDAEPIEPESDPLMDPGQEPNKTIK